MSQIIDLLIKNGSCFEDKKLQKVELAISNSKIQEIGDSKNLAWLKIECFVTTLFILELLHKI